MKLLFWKKPKCKNGHKLIEANLYYYIKKKDGRRYKECRTCNLQRGQKRYVAKRQGDAK